MKNLNSAFLQWGDVRARSYEHLSERELEVLRLVARGMNAREIASEFVRSEHTVRNHIRSSLHKLRASNKIQAVVTAMRLGLIE